MAVAAEGSKIADRFNMPGYLLYDVDEFISAYLKSDGTQDLSGERIKLQAAGAEVACEPEQH